MTTTDQRKAIADVACKWTQDTDDEYPGDYGTACGQLFSITEGTPEDNHFRFCCYCGKPIQQVLAQQDEAEENLNDR